MPRGLARSGRLGQHALFTVKRRGARAIAHRFVAEVGGERGVRLGSDTPGPQICQIRTRPSHLARSRGETFVLGAALIVRTGDALLARQACIAFESECDRVGLMPCMARPRPIMRFASGTLLGALAATGAVMGPASGAPGEAVSMAYACRVSSSHVILESSAERTYRILGKRDSQTLRVCSGPSASTCRTLEIHRFALECDGNVVQWIDAAAAAVRGQPWRATLSDGRMTRHYWPEGPAKDRRLPLTLPEGFAPAPAAGWRFDTVGAASSEAPVAAPRPTLSVPATSPAQATEPVPPTAAPFKQPMGQGWSATVVVGLETEANPWWSPFAFGTGQHAWLALIGLVALLLSATAVAARQHVGVRLPFGLASRAGGLPDAYGIAASAPSATEPVPPPPLPRAGLSAEAADHVSELASVLASVPAPRVPSEWDAVIEMQTTAEALLELVRQMIADHVPDGALRDVLIADIDAISQRLDGSELAAALDQGRLDLVHPIYAHAILDLERVRTLARIEHQRAIETIGEPERTPETVDEACAFLGINPRAAPAVVKKVVDALRQNWHPDLAEDELDRRIREERIKRINAAWDLIRAG